MHGPANNPTRVQVQHRSCVKPTISRPDVGEISNPLLVGCVDLKLAVQNVVSNRTALASVLWEYTASGACPQSLLTHETFNSMQATVVTQGQDVMPHTSCSIGPVAAR